MNMLIAGNAKDQELLAELTIRCKGAVARTALGRIDDDHQLVRVALTAPDQEIRDLATRAIENVELLRRIARESEDATARSTAEWRIGLKAEEQRDGGRMNRSRNPAEFELQLDALRL